MIRKLQLTNFRRHADTTIDLASSDAQVIAISGRNGAGKTTLLEAITHALHGESRTGRRNLDSLIRRGAGPEGMEVTLDFDVAGTPYQVTRRRDGRSSTATLYANGVPIVEKPDAVTDHISSLFGLDAVGFRLAVIAQQKELDGLASLRPGERAKMLSRLLRLDSIADAKQAAAAAARDATNIVTGIGDAPDLTAATTAVQAATDQLDAARRDADAAKAALEELDAKLAGSIDVDRAIAAAQRALSAAEGHRDGAARRLQTAKAQLAAHPRPDDINLPSPDQLRTQIAEANVEIERARAAARDAERMAVIVADHDAAVAKVASVDAWLATVAADVDADTATCEAVEVAAGIALHTATATRDTAQQTLADRRDAAGAARSAIAVATATLDQARAARADVDTLDATCDRCDQPIDDTHRAELTDRLDAAVADAEQALEAATADAATAATAVTEAEQALADATARVATLTQTVRHAEEATSQRADATRRINVYASQIAAQDTTGTIDLDEVLARRTDLEMALGTSEAHQVAMDAHVAAVQAVADTEADLAAAAAAVDDAQVDPDLEAAWTQRQRWARDRNDAADLHAAATADVRVAQAAVDAATQRAADAAAVADRLATHRRDARVHGLAREVLAAAHTRMNGKIRPAMQGAVIDLLTQMSDGRFTDVKVTADYDVHVVDDGRSRPLAQLSGGEQDLVALAVRLALASVVIDRHGAAQPGFIILDEVFGSQDAGRRQAILSTLRTLRARYGQILLISHVGGIEDAADQVIDLSLTDGVAAATLI